MKKTSRKSKKVVKKKPSAPKVPEVMKTLPDVVPGAVNVAFSFDELANYAQLLHIMSENLDSMAIVAAEDKDVKTFDVLTARSQLSLLLAGKLSAHYVIGESPSREVH